MLRKFARKDELHGLLAQALRFIPEERPTVENIVRKLMEFCGEIPVLDGVQEIAESSGFFGKLIKWIKNLFKPNGVKVTVIKIRDIIINNSGAVLLGIVGIVVFALVVVLAMVIIAKQPANPIYVPVPPVTNQPPSTSYQITTTSSETVLTLPLTTTPTTVPSETLQTTTTTLAATTTSRPFQTERTYTPPPSTDPQSSERTEPPETTTVTLTEPPTNPTTTTTKAATTTTTTAGVGVENGFAYSLENGTATITGYQGTVTEVVIPEYVAGVPVYAIGANAFANTEIASVELLAGVQRIEAEAFRGCTYLQQVILPISIKYIGPDAFTRNYDAETITIYYRDSSVGWNQIEKTDADFEKDYIETSFNYGIEW